jgi:hypothetical protein
VGKRIYVTVADSTTDYQALIVGQVQDELTSEPVEDFDVHTPSVGVLAKATPDGFFALSGYPGQVFPRLASTSYTVAVSLTAPGYRAVSLPILVPQGTSVPVSVPAVTLRHVPVRLQGRVVEDSVARQPIQGAKVRFVDDPVSPSAEHVVALRSPLSFSHTLGSAARERTLTPSGAPKQLAASAPGGSQTITLGDRTAIGGGDILQLDAADAVEYAVIASVSPTPPNLNLPGAVVLRAPLDRTHTAGTPVQKVTAGAVGAIAQVLQPAEVGDGLVILNQPLTADTLEILDPDPTHTEYRALGVLTDADGFYHFDGVGRVRALFLDAGAAGYQPLAQPIPWTLQYDQPVNVVSLQLAR